MNRSPCAPGRAAWQQFPTPSKKKLPRLHPRTQWRAKPRRPRSIFCAAAIISGLSFVSLPRNAAQASASGSATLTPPSRRPTAKRLPPNAITKVLEELDGEAVHGACLCFWRGRSRTFQGSLLGHFPLGLNLTGVNGRLDGRDNCFTSRQVVGYSHGTSWHRHTLETRSRFRN